MRKVIHCELCKRLKFDYTTKCYRHKQEIIQENETRKILEDLGLNGSFNPGLKVKTCVKKMK